MTSTPTAAQTPLSDQVAEEIRGWMGKRRISGRELARRLGVSAMWVSTRLTGTQPVDLNDLAQIARALGVRVLDLLPADLADEVAPPVPPAPPTQRDRHGRRGGGSLTRRYVTRPERVTSPATPISATRRNPIGSRPRDTRPPGQPLSAIRVKTDGLAA